ncbi:hypothetical protein V2J09_008702 [Rumex salicifolius]
MVIGPKAKTRRGPSVQVDYQILLEEIKPWPPSQNLKNVRSVLIQWENSDRSSGSSSSASPSLTDSRIEFNESFKLHVTLFRDLSVKNGDAHAFHKSLLEFNLYEPRRDKTVKGQLLGTSILDLADSGIIKEAKSVAIPLNCTRSFRNTAQPVLHLRIQPAEKGRLKPGQLKQASNEDCSEEAELASLTDDDGSSHSSLTVDSIGSLAASNSMEGSVAAKENDGSVKEFHAQSSKIDHARSDIRPELRSYENQKGSSSDLSSLDPTSQHVSASNESPSTSPTSVAASKFDSGDSAFHALSSASSIAVDNSKDTHGGGDSHQNIQENMPNTFTAKCSPINGHVNLHNVNGTETQAGDGDEDLEEVPNTNEIKGAESKDGQNDEDEGYSLGDEWSCGDSSTSASGRKQVLLGDDFGGRVRLNPVRSIRSSTDSLRSNGSVGGSNIIIEKKDAKVYPSERRNVAPEVKVLDLERRIKMLEGELREAAAIEASLYSVVAEHGSSISKVHAPARRLSRMYIQAVKGNYQSRRASAAQTAVSGLVVVAKACGNDVPRLAFWLSNCIVLRAIITQAFEEQRLPVSGGSLINKNAVGKRSDKKSPKLTWKASSSNRKDMRTAFSGNFDDWEDPLTFTSALEKVESWIFSLIVESVWWQTLTLHMQSSATRVVDKIIDSGSKKSFKRTSTSGGQEQVNLSLELWKKAFKDACERLCPVRAGGHECGCLPVLAKLIMEQCVARLDVAMFNALLRESIDDIPTDPVSDPISEPKVLPIPAGRSSFGAGAQLKNAIGNWSRLLSDLFGMDDDDPDEDSYSSDADDEKRKRDSSFKSFHLLKSLSDLMMLPKDMLLSSSVRKEVCPSFSAQFIRMALDSFVPDEFCPDPIPDDVLVALESEEVADEEEGIITSVPCTAPSVVYAPPQASSLARVIGEEGSQSQLRRSSSVLRKSNTSDDELEELDSPFTRILDKLPTSLARTKLNVNGTGNAIRYQLLREMWMSCE